MAKLKQIVAKRANPMPKIVVKISTIMLLFKLLKRIIILCLKKKKKKDKK